MNQLARLIEPDEGEELDEQPAASRPAIAAAAAAADLYDNLTSTS